MIDARKLVLTGMLFGVTALILITIWLGGSRAGRVQAREELATAGEGCAISAAYPDAVRQWCDVIQQYASENGLDPNLVSALILHESDGKPDAYSKSGAVGLMQVMPSDGLAASFTCPNGPCFEDRPSMKELFDPDFNVAFGTRLLAQLIQSTGNLREALKDYGPKDVGYSYADMILRTFYQKQ